MGEDGSQAWGAEEWRGGVEEAPDGVGGGWALGTQKFLTLRWGLVGCLSPGQGDLESRAEKGGRGPAPRLYIPPEALRKLPGLVWDQACEDSVVGWWFSYRDKAGGGSGRKVTPF